MERGAGEGGRFLSTVGWRGVPGQMRAYGGPSRPGLVITEPSGGVYEPRWSVHRFSSVFR